MNLEKLENNLNLLGYKVSIFDDVDTAKKYLCENIQNTSVGIGGSVTIKDMGLYEALEKNNEVYWHWQKDELIKASNADIYLSSVNGISEDGEIVNIDGKGNRVASIIYGHKKVYFILGINKIEENLDKAIYRARNIAAVKNAIRLNKNTPCVVTNKCMNCKSKERICRALSVLLAKPSGGDYEVVIIKKELGF